MNHTMNASQASAPNTFGLTQSGRFYLPCVLSEMQGEYEELAKRLAANERFDDAAEARKVLRVLQKLIQRANER